MPTTQIPVYTRPTKQYGRRHVIWPLTIVAVIIFSIIIFLLQVKIISFEESANLTDNSSKTTKTTLVNAFPIGVNPKTKTVTENPSIDTFLNNSVASNHTDSKSPRGWFAMLREKLSTSILFQNFASPISRTLIVRSGDRTEEVANNFAHILGWSSSEKAEFITKMTEQIPEATNGKIYPGTYVSDKDASPDQISGAVISRFDSEVRARYTSDIEAQVPLHDTLIIASLLEREAYSFDDMRYISGVIWNRLFIGMKLQIDATLQFARANKTDTSSWWPVPVPNDKYINSPYNTYQNVGLPPEPIANPSVDAIIAALNPRKTDCLFYFHDTHGKFYCSKTYEEHVALLKQIFGQGR